LLKPRLSRATTILLVTLTAGVAVTYAVSTHMFTHQLGGFPPARTDIWVVGGNQTLSWNGAAPEFNSSGTFNFPNVADVTCGGLASCNVTVTVSGVPTGWGFVLVAGNGLTYPLPNGSTTIWFNAPCTFHCRPIPLGWYSYEVDYVNYPVDGTPPISVTWTWTS